MKNPFRKSINNDKKIKDLENRIKVLSDSLENESEAVEIYKNEYDKLLAKYKETEYKLTYALDSIKIFKTVLEQNKKYTNEECTFESVSNYSNYLLVMIQFILDYACPEEKENNVTIDTEKIKSIRDGLSNIASCMQKGYKIDPSYLKKYIEEINEILNVNEDKKENKE